MRFWGRRLRKWIFSLFVGWGHLGGWHSAAVRGHGSFVEQEGR